MNIQISVKLVFDEKSINLSIEGPLELLNSSFSKEVFSVEDSEGELVLSGLNNLSPGIYEFNMIAESENNSYSYSFKINYQNEILVSPDNNSEKLNLFPELIWEQNDNVGQFRLQVSKDDDFGNLELDEILFKNKEILINLMRERL